MGADLPHLPLLRAGRPYRSLDTAVLAGAGGEPVIELSQANPGLIARDLAGAAEHQRALARPGTAELLAVCRRAALLFESDELPLGDGRQSAEDYVAQLGATTGLPHTVARQGRGKIARVLAAMDEVLAGLSRGLDLTCLERGHAREGARTVAFVRESDVLGAVLPGNSPGVHGLWLPAIPLGVTLALKPGRNEPWTPWRLAQALLAAGCPPEGLGYYPAGWEGAAALLRRSGRSLLFGAGRTVEPWRHDPRIEIHGPGRSKVLVGPDRIDAWQEHLDLIVDSIASGAGRSCLNASGVWVPERGIELAEALAARLEAIEPRPLDHPEAVLAAFPEPQAARALSDWIDAQLAIPGAEDVTARRRGGGGRLVEAFGLTFLLPTVIRCDDPEHPLARVELLFPFASVVEVDAREMVARLGPTLVATALTEDPVVRDALLRAPHVDRVHLGPIPTTRVSFDQPHEGNLFDHLYRRRSLLMAGAGGA